MFRSSRRKGLSIPQNELTTFDAHGGRFLHELKRSEVVNMVDWSIEKGRSQWRPTLRKMGGREEGPAPRINGGHWATTWMKLPLDQLWIFWILSNRPAMIAKTAAKKLRRAPIFAAA